MSVANSTVLAGMRLWADEHFAAMVQRHGNPQHLFRPVGQFMAHRTPPKLRTLPVFYPFSGVDLWWATALFPHAPRYVMLAYLPLGNLEPFADSGCRDFYAYIHGKFYGGAAFNHFAWTSTTDMLRRFESAPWESTARPGVSPDGRPARPDLWTQNCTHFAPMGVLPALLFTLRAHNHTLTGAALDGDRLTLTTDRTVVTYLRRKVSTDPEVRLAELAAIGASELLAPRILKYATLIKAAGEMRRIMSDSPDTVRWLLSISDAVVSDDTGLAPADLADAGFVVRGHGRYTEDGRKCLNIGLDSGRKFMPACVSRGYESCEKSAHFGGTDSPGVRYDLANRAAEEALWRQREATRAADWAHLANESELPFLFGYSPTPTQWWMCAKKFKGEAWRAEDQPKGAMLTSWRPSVDPEGLCSRAGRSHCAVHVRIGSE